MTYKKLPLDDTALPYGATSAYAVFLDGVRGGVVYRRETTRTGFRRGRCVGQVAVQGWFYSLQGQPEQGSRAYGGPRWLTLAAAKVALEGACTRQCPSMLAELAAPSLPKGQNE